MKLTFIREAEGRPLTKQFRQTPSGELESSNYYLQYYLFDSIEEEVGSIEDFAKRLAHHASLGHAVVKGNYLRTLRGERRAQLVDKSAPTQWLCLDLDGLHCPDYNQILASLNMHDVSHVVQYSASHGVKPGLRAHIFMLLDAPVREETLKQWLMYVNLTDPVLKQSLQLTSTGNALKWALDVTLAELHRVIYIAAPEFMGMQDPFLPGGTCAALQRIELVTRSRAAFSIASALQAANLPAVTALKAEARDALRLAAGYRKRKEVLRYVEKYNAYVSVGPDRASVTGYKEERGFCYLNLNGGDSWGYYHPIDNYDVVYNFKGESPYLTKELLPDYYVSCTQRKKQAAEKAQDLTAVEGPKRFVFTEKQSGSYYKAYWDPAKELRDLSPARSREQLQDYCIIHNLPVPTAVPVYETVFEPHSPLFFDPGRETVNLYQPSRYKKNCKASQDGPPRRIEALIRHVTGDDVGAYQHFMNWLAYIWQYGRKPKTAWVLHGTTGTGKGTLMEQVLKPLFGSEQAVETTVLALTENFNGYMLKAQILMVDEADTDGMGNVALMRAKFNNWITEDTISVREMRKGAYQSANYTAFIFTSNKRNPVLIDPEDRRFNVAPRQERKLTEVFDLRDFSKLEGELQAFADYLQGYAVDVDAVRTPLQNAAKQQVQATTSSTPEDVINAVLQGNFGALVDYLPSGIGSGAPHAAALIASQHYKDVLQHIHETLSISPGHEALVTLSRDSIAALCAYALGWNMPPAKFSKTVSKFGLHFATKRNPQNPREFMRGFATVWKATPEDLQAFTDAVAPPAKTNVTPLRAPRA